MPYVAVPTNVGAPPLVGYAQAWTRSTPVPPADPRSRAQPETWNPFDATVAFSAGVSIFINGLGVGAVGVGAGAGAGAGPVGVPGSGAGAVVDTVPTASWTIADVKL